MNQPPSAREPEDTGSRSSGIVVTTHRLMLREFRTSDLSRYAELNADPEVMRYLGGVTLDRRESDSIVEEAQQVFADRGFAMLAVERRNDGAFLGACGLGLVPWYPDDVEIGWRLAREHWGHGYATEAARAWLEYGFRRLNLSRVISVTDFDPPNLRSLAVMHRLDMTLDHEADLVDQGVTFHAAVHAIGKDTWRSATPSRCDCVNGG